MEKKYNFAKRCLGGARSRGLNNQSAWVPGNLVKVDTDGLIHTFPSL